MGKKSTSSTTQQGWTLLRLALLQNQQQELTDTLAAESQAKRRLMERHRQEMASISLFINPLGWAIAITRYQTQLTELLISNQLRRRSFATRQKKELIELDQWIAQQRHQADDGLLFD
ncbi:hypothetical protein [Spirosoma endophyticum]|uniref:Flagellar FliJ protein n=1 Tax=Spirosoma endophyticum TaxID=662367 RepID=A0A1I2E955_9BACT|nr:hypothetical protein [Spirosoma endophyticum]SFE89375.1 hypothetical protein SAMN05216167_12172 [Spirosoma endophyticum]